MYTRSQAHPRPDLLGLRSSRGRAEPRQAPRVHRRRRADGGDRQWLGLPHAGSWTSTRRWIRGRCRSRCCSATSLKEFSTKYRQYAADELRPRRDPAAGPGREGGRLRPRDLDDGRSSSDITIWAAGVAIQSVASSFPQDKRGRPRSTTTAGQGFRVYAAGDIAGQDEPLPQLAQPAIQTGEAAARNIAAEVAGKPRKTFAYTNLGTMATIGRHAAIAEIPVLGGLSGSVGWAAWLGVHIMKMIGHRNQRAVAMNLLSLYSGTRATHQPNPVVGEVPAARGPHLRRGRAPYVGANAEPARPTTSPRRIPRTRRTPPSRPRTDAPGRRQDPPGDRHRGAAHRPPTLSPVATRARRRWLSRCQWARHRRPSPVACRRRPWSCPCPCRVPCHRCVAVDRPRHSPIRNGRHSGAREPRHRGRRAARA